MSINSQMFYKTTQTFFKIMYYCLLVNKKNYFFIYFFFQDSNTGSKAVPMSPSADGEDVESPMPLPQNFSAVRRRGAVSAEPITEEDIATYVKKVCSIFFTFILL